jgi:hypothetical protein
VSEGGGCAHLVILAARSPACSVSPAAAALAWSCSSARTSPFQHSCVSRSCSNSDACDGTPPPPLLRAAVVGSSAEAMPPPSCVPNPRCCPSNGAVYGVAAAQRAVPGCISRRYPMPPLASASPRGAAGARAARAVVDPGRQSCTVRSDSQCCLPACGRLAAPSPWRPPSAAPRARLV